MIDLFTLSVRVAAWNGYGTDLNFDISVVAAMIDVNGAVESNVFLLCDKASDKVDSRRDQHDSIEQKAHSKLSSDKDTE